MTRTKLLAKVVKTSLHTIPVVGLFVVLAYVLSDLWFSAWLYFGVHWSGAESWSYWHTVTHWGAVAPVAVGFVHGIFRLRSTS